MEFIFKDIDNLTEDELLKLLDQNKEISNDKKRELTNLSNVKNKKKIEIITPKKEFIVPKESIETKEVIIDDLDDETDEFEDKIDFYLSELRKLDIKETDDILDSLPTRNNYDYKKIILRLIMEFKKDINDINSIIKKEELSKKELIDLKNEINTNNKMISLLKELLEYKEEEKEEHKQKNNLFFSTTPSGNVRVIEELESIADEYYPLFQELFESIEDGSFKGIKRFTNNNELKGALEVRAPKVRIIFTKLSKNNYMAVTAFTKKLTMNRGYIVPIKLKYLEYKKEEKKMKELVDDPDFIIKNAEYKEKLYSLLGNKKKKVR